jgi:hypothetical protein
MILILPVIGELLCLRMNLMLEEKKKRLEENKMIKKEQNKNLPK